MRQCKQGTIGATHAHTEGKPKTDNTGLVLAAWDVSRFLADGSWQRKKFVEGICRHHGVTLDALSKICGIAESDDGRWVCSITPNGDAVRVRDGE